MTNSVKNYKKQYIDSITHNSTISSIHKSSKYTRLCVNYKKIPKISIKLQTLQDIVGNIMTTTK